MALIPADTTPATTLKNAALDISKLGRRWGWMLLAGVLTVLGGLAAIMAPAFATLAVSTVLAILLVSVGVINLAAVFTAERGYRMATFVTGTAFTVLGGAMLLFPVANMVALTLLAVSMLMFEGSVRIAVALDARPQRGWGWVFAGGMATVLLSFALVAQLPMTAFWLIGVLIGVDLLFNGSTQIALALAARGIAADDQGESLARPVDVDTAAPAKLSPTATSAQQSA